MKYISFCNFCYNSEYMAHAIETILTGGKMRYCE